MHATLNPNAPPLLFVISAPAGGGKTTLVAQLMKEFPEFARCITTTTRVKRASEKEGVDYHFVNKESFAAMVKQGLFLEHATIYGKEYGTAKRDIEALHNKGKHVVLVIDTQGFASLQTSKLPMVSIFINPPDLDTLEERLDKRATENEKNKALRLAKAKQEMAMATEYDYSFTNDTLDRAYSILRAIVIASTYKNFTL